MIDKGQFVGRFGSTLQGPCRRCNRSSQELEVYTALCRACFAIRGNKPTMSTHERMLATCGVLAILLILASYGLALWQAMIGNWWPILISFCYLIGRGIGDGFEREVDKL